MAMAIHLAAAPLKGYPTSRFSDAQLADQSCFVPYPREAVDIQTRLVDVVLLCQRSTHRLREALVIPGTATQLRHEVDSIDVILVELERLASKWSKQPTELVDKLEELIKLSKSLLRELDRNLRPSTHHKYSVHNFSMRSLSRKSNGFSSERKKALRATKETFETLETSLGLVTSLINSIAHTSLLPSQATQPSASVRKSTKYVSTASHCPLFRYISQPNTPGCTGGTLQSPDLRLNEVFNHFSFPCCRGRTPTYTIRHRYYQERRLSGTCEWFLKNQIYTRWLAGESAELLWCYGEPGIGKSTLVSKVIDNLRESASLKFAYYYMGDSKSEAESVTELMASLLEQSCLRNNFIPPSLEKYSNDRLTPPSNPIDLYMKAFEEVNTMCRRNGSRIQIIIDGWDEPSSKRDYERILKLFRRLSCQVLITSREAPGSHISEQLLNLKIKAEDNQEDICKVVEQAIDSNISAPAHPFLRPGKLREQVINQLVQGASGRFFWAVMETDLVLEQTSVQAIHQELEGFLGDARTMIWENVLKRIEQQPDDLAELAKTTLIWLANLQSPISNLAFRYALALRTVFLTHSPLSVSDDLMPSEEAIRECCKGLILIEPISDPVNGNPRIGLKHSAIAEQLSRNWPCAHAVKNFEFTKVILDFLLLKNFGDGACETQGRLSTRYLEVYPFLQYAACHWGDHVQNTICELTKIKNTHKSQHEGIAKLENCLNELHDLTSKLLDSVNMSLALQIMLRHEIYGNIAITWDEILRKSKSMTRLHVAARFGLLDIIETRLKKGDDPNVKDENHSTPLHEVVKAGRVDAVERLIRAGASVTALDCYRQTPLHYAVLRDDEATFVALFKQLCVEYLGALSGTPPTLLDGIEDKNVLLQFYNTISSSQQHHTVFPLKNRLLAAVEREDLCYTLYLLDRNRSEELQNCGNDEGPILHLAIRKRSKNIVRALLGFGASHKALNNLNESALHIAAAVGDVNIVRLLLQYGADVRSVDNRGRSVLFSAVRYRPIITVLLYNGADILAADGDGNSVLQQAAKIGTLETIGSLDYLLSQVEDFKHIPLASPTELGKKYLEELYSHGMESARRLLREVAE